MISKQAFFVVAQFAKQNPALIQRMQDEGHLVGVHGLAHKNGMLQTPWQAYSDFQQARQIMRHLGVNVKYVLCAPNVSGRNETDAVGRHGAGLECL